LASRRRRRKSIGKVIVDVERRVRRVEKRPGAKRLKTNVVTTEKLGYRAVSTKTIQPDAVTANEAEFGITVVSATDPDIIKEGTTVVDPDTGATKVYSTDINDFVVLTDPVAQAASEGKNSTYYQDAAPTGGTYLTGDMWVDTNDDYKLYVWSGTAWVLSQDSASAQTAADNAQDTADDKNKTYVQTAQPTGGTYYIGDLWIDTDDGNKLYRYSGTAWVSAQDSTISTAQNTADGKNKVYYDTAAPGSTANKAGDIWWQYSAGVVVGQYVGAGGTSWTSAPIGNAVIANLDAGKITTGYLDVSGSVVFTTDKTKSGNQSRIEINSLGFYAYNGSTATVSITNTGTAAFTGTITGSSFTSTNFASGTGVSITSSSGIDQIKFNVGGVEKASLAIVSGGLVVTSGSASLTMTSLGAISLSSASNTLLMSTAPYFTGGSGSNTGGGYGSIRNTWASSGDPSGGDLGDVWLKWV